MLISYVYLDKTISFAHVLPCKFLYSFWAYLMNPFIMRFIFLSLSLKKTTVPLFLGLSIFFDFPKLVLKCLFSAAIMGDYIFLSGDICLTISCITSRIMSFSLSKFPERVIFSYFSLPFWNYSYFTCNYSYLLNYRLT